MVGSPSPSTSQVLGSAPGCVFSQATALQKVAAEFPNLKFTIPVGKHGDVFDRFMVRMAEAYQSIQIVKQCLDQMPGGLVLNPDLPKTLRIDEGECYVRTEGTKGEYGVYALAKGGNKPYRMKLRSPSFCNLSALKEMVVGHYVADAIIILGSLDIVLGEVDK